MMKDYYQILGVTPDSDADEIRRKYRKLAMEYHPDRNPDVAGAEEKFKEVAEAYGVLTDPVKRKEYDSLKASGGDRDQAAGSGGFQYSQEEILKDLFQDPRFQQLFQGLLREFQRSGFRANSHFVRQSFFGGKGGLIFGGLFLFGSIAGPKILQSARKGLPRQKSLLKSVGSTIGALLTGAKVPEEAATEAAVVEENDITYITPLSADELRHGKIVQVVSNGPDGQEMLRVTIPPGSKKHQKLRLRGRGQVGSHGRGDLFLELDER